MNRLKAVNLPLSTGVVKEFDFDGCLDVFRGMEDRAIYVFSMHIFYKTNNYMSYKVAKYSYKLSLDPTNPVCRSKYNYYLSVQRGGTYEFSDMASSLSSI